MRQFDLRSISHTFHSAGSAHHARWFNLTENSILQDVDFCPFVTDLVGEPTLAGQDKTSNRKPFPEATQWILDFHVWIYTNPFRFIRCAYVSPRYTVSVLRSHLNGCESERMLGAKLVTSRCGKFKHECLLSALRRAVYNCLTRPRTTHPVRGLYALCIGKALDLLQTSLGTYVLMQY